MGRTLLALALLVVAVVAVWIRWPSPESLITGTATSDAGVEGSDRRSYDVRGLSAERHPVSSGSVRFRVVGANGSSLPAVALVGPRGENITETDGSGISAISRESVPDGAIVTFLKEGFVAARVPLDYAVPEQTIVLQAGRRIVVEVLSTDGAPIAGAVVALSAGPLAASLGFPPGQSTGATLQVGPAGVRRTTHRISDERGEALFTELATGEAAYVRCSKEGYIACPPPDHESGSDPYSNRLRHFMAPVYVGWAVIEGDTLEQASWRIPGRWCVETVCAQDELLRIHPGSIACVFIPRPGRSVPDAIPVSAISAKRGCVNFSLAVRQFSRDTSPQVMDLNAGPAMNHCGRKAIVFLSPDGSIAPVGPADVDIVLMDTDVTWAVDTAGGRALKDIDPRHRKFSLASNGAMTLPLGRYKIVPKRDPALRQSMTETEFDVTSGGSEELQVRLLRPLEKCALTVHDGTGHQFSQGHIRISSTFGETGCYFVKPNIDFWASPGSRVSIRIQPGLESASVHDIEVSATEGHSQVISLDLSSGGYEAK